MRVINLILTIFGVIIFLIVHNNRTQKIIHMHDLLAFTQFLIRSRS